MSKITKKMALDYHHLVDKPGKICVVPTKPYQSQTDLTLAYSPGVGFPCLEIKDNADDVYNTPTRATLWQ